MAGKKSKKIPTFLFMSYLKTMYLQQLKKGVPLYCSWKVYKRGTFPVKSGI